MRDSDFSTAYYLHQRLRSGHIEEFVLLCFPPKKFESNFACEYFGYIYIYPGVIPHIFNPINIWVPKKVPFYFKTICQFLLKCLNLLFCVVCFCHSVNKFPFWEKRRKTKLLQGDGSHLPPFWRTPRRFHPFSVFYPMTHCAKSVIEEMPLFLIQKPFWKLTEWISAGPFYFWKPVQWIFTK